MKKRTKLAAISLVVILAITMILGACNNNTPTNTGSTPAPTPSQPAPSQPSGGGDSSGDEAVVITMGLPVSWNHLIPYHPPTAYQIEVCTVIFDLLTRINDKGDIEPRAAESWSSSDDLSSLTINLRKDLYWHDGQQVTSKDWRFTFELMTSPAAAELISQGKLEFFAGTNIGGQLEAGQTLGLETPDDFTLIINFKSPISAYSFFTNYAYMLFVLPEHLLSSQDPSNILEWDYWRAPIGSGPCRFVSENAGVEIVLDAVDNYPIGDLQFDRLIYRVVTPDAAVSALLAGEINGGYYTGFTQDTIAPLEGVAGVRTELMTSVSTFSALCINNEKYDADFRKAINYAIDKEMICQAIYFGDADPSNTSLRPTSPMAVETWQGRNLDLAREHLDKSSYTPGAPLKLACAPGLRTDIAAVLQQNFADIGIQVEIITQEQPSVLTGLSDGTFDLGIGSFSSMAFPTWITNMPIFFQNLCHIEDQSLYFAYRDQASVATNDAEMSKVAEEFQALWEDEMPAAPLWHAYGWYIFSDWLQNVTALETSACWQWVVAK